MRAFKRLLVLLGAEQILVFGAGCSQTRGLAPEDFVVRGNVVHCLVYLPQGYRCWGEPWPLLVFLHGGGERGEDIGLVRAQGLPKLIDAGMDVPLIVVAPQCRKGRWDPEMLNDLMVQVESRYRVDRDRIYVTGLSIGGTGTWELAARHPDRVAAIAPICGESDPRWAERLKGVPAWAFHGANDVVIPLSTSETMVQATDAAGGEARLTVYPQGEHNCWDEAYQDPELYRWLLSHRLSTNRNAK